MIYVFIYIFALALVWDISCALAFIENTKNQKVYDEQRKLSDQRYEKYWIKQAESDHVFMKQLDDILNGFDKSK